MMREGGVETRDFDPPPISASHLLFFFRKLLTCYHEEIKGNQEHKIKLNMKNIHSSTSLKNLENGYFLSGGGRGGGNHPMNRKENRSCHASQKMTGMHPFDRRHIAG